MTSAYYQDSLRTDFVRQYNARIYLDHAAATPVDSAVQAAMAPYIHEQWHNPSARYEAARSTRRAVEAARADIAHVLAAKPTEIIFTASATESANLAVQGVLRAAAPGAHWITTAIEHEAVLAQVPPLERQGYPATVVPVSMAGIVSVRDIMAAVTDGTVLVSMMLANNEIGTLQPVAEVARAVAAVRLERLARGVGRPLYVHTDATQAGNYVSLQVSRLGVDMLALNAAKLYGPKGIGLLYVRHGTKLEPLFYGGGQERGRRSGTEPVAGCVGLAAALVAAASRRDSESHRLTGLRDEAIEALLAAVPGARLNGDPQRRLPNNISLTLPGADGEALVLYLDNAGFETATGSACAASQTEPSHVLLAIGRSRSEAAQSLRLTLGRSTDEDALAALVRTLPGIVERVRALPSVA